jgi:hypothetical protein|tara:strand:- start:1493 stop:2227 length:735 start_codon:yes stop_codon:yes gene_type:complete
MFGSHFYHQRMRTAVATFGSLFNNINIVRKSSSGNILSDLRVPLAYAPRRTYLDRINQMNLGEAQERQVALSLPRMSFEIVNIAYDNTRQLPKTLKTKMVRSNDSVTKLASVYTPTPYLINLQLNCYAKTQDDALQMVEQILPYFDPQYTVTIIPLDDFSTIKEDVPIRLDGVTFLDDYEGAVENRRTIIYTLDFEMKINLYKNLNSAGSKIIREADVYMFDINNATGDSADAFSNISFNVSDL